MVLVRRMAAEDAPAVAAVEERAFADAHDMATFREGDYLRQLARHPEGQFVALDPATGDVVGAALSLRVDEQAALRRHRWWDATGGTGFAAHDPAGAVLYGADAFVDPAWQGRGAGRALYAARLQLLSTTDCVAFATGGRMPGYGALAARMTPQDYVRRVEEGALRDPVLGFQLAQGMVALDVMPQYLPDATSGHHACLVALPNPARSDARGRVMARRVLPWSPPATSAGEESARA